MIVRVALAKLSIESEGYGAEDITESVRKLDDELGLVRGSLTIYSTSRGCFVLGIEYEPNLLSDLEEMMSRLGCTENRFPCLALFNKPLTAVVIDGELRLGVFRRVVFIDVSREKGLKEVIVVAEGLFRHG